MSCVSQSVAANICLTLITTDDQFNEDALHPIKRRACVTRAVVAERSTMTAASFMSLCAETLHATAS